MRQNLNLILFAIALAGCGVGGAPNRVPTASQALTGTAEWLEFETPQTRADLFTDIAKSSITQAGQPATDQSLFPMLTNNEFVGAPALDPKTDLLQAPDAGVIQLVLDGNSERWSEDRRDSLQGLSEREAVELIARSLIHLWGLQPDGPVRVDRAAGAPYAAAWVDGILKVNPSFVYMAAAPAP
jgi:hypothetical protein